MAAGYALGRGAPALALLHRTPGLGNAVAALATARLNRAPLVVIVGQQDRRHLALDPFLAGRLDGLAGEYPVWSDQPARAQDVPGAIVRAYHEAATARGPALVIVPMDDWTAPAPEPHEIARPGAAAALRGRRPGRGRGARRRCSTAPSAPAIVAGAGADGDEGWAALIALAERLGCPVFQEPFGGARRLPAGPPAVRRPPARAPRAAARDARALRRRARRRHRRDPPVPVRPGPAGRADGTRARASSRRTPRRRTAARSSSPCSATPRAICAALAEAVDARRAPADARSAAPGRAAAARARRAAVRRPRPRRRSPTRLPRDAILLEETPSSRPELHARIPATAPLGFISAMGMLGFALPAAIGVRMARPDRPVLDRRRRRLEPLPDPGAVERGRLRAPACCSSSCATAATRS